ncbi:unnamed protein product [Rotaria sp. Silwood1]|nr:unnamed protein product [Rotaria sp. Silwood1]
MKVETDWESPPATKLDISFSRVAIFLITTRIKLVFGSNCRQLSDSTHCDRFQHPSQTSSLNTVAPPDDQLSNMNADTSRSSRSHASNRNDDTQKAYSIGDTMNSGRSNQQDQTTIKSSTSNTKQQCRYGSNCRQLSDSTHCDRFQHPTQTISAFGAAASSDDRLSNKSFDTSSSSHIHTKHGDDMQKASSIGDTMNSGRSNQSDQTTKKTLTSGTKQDCRYGSNCRQLSDPTHCDRFQHPTQTISAFGAAASSDDRLSSKNFDTSSSSHIHTKHGDDMQKAYSIGAAIALESLSQQDQISIKTMREDAIIIVPGTFDHIDRVLSKLNLKYTTVQQYEVINYPFRTYQTVYINCASSFPKEGAHRLRELVEKGLNIITTDWALKNVLQVAFSDFVQDSGKSTRDEVVGIEVADPNHPFVKGFVSAAKHAEPQWWLETASHPIHIVNKEKVKVLIRSQALYDKYQSDAVIVTFDCGQGNVTHMISHFYLQRSETPNSRHKMGAQQYAEDIKASDQITKLITKEGQDLNYAQIQSSSTSAQFIYNLLSNRLNSTKQSTS